MRNSLIFVLFAILYILNVCSASDSNELTNERNALIQICQKFKAIKQIYCIGIRDSRLAVLSFLYRNGSIDLNILCSLFCTGHTKINHEWNLKIDNNGIDINKSKSDIPIKGDNDLKILHITDIHFDPKYRPGALVLSRCRRMPTEPVHADKIAGYWGDGICHVPIHLIENAFDHMRNTHEQIDFIYYTGDTIPYTETQVPIKKILTEIYDLISKKFPGIPVFSCLGNHDSYPYAFFSPEDVPANISTRWLYEHVYQLWSKWLTKDTKETILKGGFYTFSPRRGFRIISLNNMDCYFANIWLLDRNYTMKQLKWLHDILLAAEVSGEYVHILMHVPSGSPECLSVWSRHFNRLVQRFHLIISGIFNGHTHYDELNIYYSSKGYAFNVAWNAGSITTSNAGIKKNPNYRIYSVEPHSMQVVDYENWSFNLTAANVYGANRMPEWYKLCHFSKDFTNDLSPSGLDALLVKMGEQPELLRKYWRCKMTNADSVMAEGCDNECMESQICEITTTFFGQEKRCHELAAKLKQNLPISSSSTTLRRKFLKVTPLICAFIAFTVL